MTDVKFMSDMHNKLVDNMHSVMYEVHNCWYTRFWVVTMIVCIKWQSSLQLFR